MCFYSEVLPSLESLNFSFEASVWNATIWCWMNLIVKLNFFHILLGCNWWWEPCNYSHGYNTAAYNVTTTIRSKAAMLVGRPWILASGYSPSMWSFSSLNRICYSKMLQLQLTIFAVHSCLNNCYDLIDRIKKSFLLFKNKEILPLAAVWILLIFWQV